MSHHVRNHDKEAFWRLVFEEQSVSGLSIRQFCQQEDLHESSFYSWRRLVTGYALIVVLVCFLPS